MVDAIVDKMLTFGETHLLGIGRGQFNLQAWEETHWTTDAGPFWAHDGLITEMDVPRLKEGGMVCVGLLNVLLRHAGQRLPFLDTKNFPEYAKYPKWKDPMKIVRGTLHGTKVYNLVTVVRTNGCIFIITRKKH